MIINRTVLVKTSVLSLLFSILGQNQTLILILARRLSHFVFDAFFDTLRFTFDTSHLDFDTSPLDFDAFNFKAF